MVASAVKAGDEALEVGSEAFADGVGSGVADSVTGGCEIGVSVTEGVGTLRSGSEVSVQPKKLERIKTVPTTPTIRLVLLRDFKLNCLNGTV
jgi:hypothetical protein